MSEIHTGSPFSHPASKHVGQWLALLRDQTPEFQAAVTSIRAWRKSQDPDFVDMPRELELTMSDGSKIRGSVVESSTNTFKGTVSVVLSTWNGPSFTWAIALVNGGAIFVEVYRNPDDPARAASPPNPMLIPRPTS
ncbi:hypothetical protein HY631_01940 [Candidatus Uhrbacteria bacterium]|nr:hypothetical protein [Candidatus Uhrbacteria bacterium]